MNTDYLSDDEQGQKVKKALKEYMPAVLIAVAIFLCFNFGTKFLSSHTEKKHETASIIYENFLNDLGHNNTDAALNNLSMLKTSFKKSAYTDFAHFLTAKYFIDKGSTDDLNKAKGLLSWVIDHSTNHDLVTLAKLRQGRLLTELNQPQDALKILNTIKNDNFLNLTYLTLADTYKKLGDKQKANEFYDKARLATPESNVKFRELINMKQS